MYLVLLLTAVVEDVLDGLLAKIDDVKRRGLREEGSTSLDRQTTSFLGCEEETEQSRCCGRSDACLGGRERDYLNVSGDPNQNPR
jgi:hypothetical protein